MGRVYHSDSVGLSFDTNDDGREDADYHVLLDWGSRQPVLLTVMRDMVLGSRDYEDRHKAFPLDPGAAIAFRETENGYLWECAIPWTMLGGFDPKGDVPLGIAVCANDADGPGRAKYRIPYPSIPDWRKPPPPVFAYGVE